MSWARLDDGILEHPKVKRVKTLGFALFVAGIVWATRHRTDGFLPAAKAKRLLNLDGLADPGEVIARLVAEKLWSEERHGYRIHDFRDYQPPPKRRGALLATRARGSSGISEPVSLRDIFSGSGVLSGSGLSLGLKGPGQKRSVELEAARARAEDRARLGRPGA